MTPSKFRVYLSGPISNNGTASPEQIEENLAVFARAAKFYTHIGYEVLSPADIAKQTSWEDYMRLAIPMVCASHVIALLPGFADSRGSVMELLIAQTLGLETAIYSEASDAYHRP